MKRLFETLSDSLKAMIYHSPQSTAIRCVGWALIGCCALLVTSAEAAEWIDLTHTFDTSTQGWPGFVPFNLSVAYKGPRDTYWLEVNNFETSEHVGTHMDAPAHFWKGGLTLEQLPVNSFVAHAALVDIEERAQRDPDTTLTAEDLAQWKSQFGEFKNPTILLVRTGNAKHWGNRARYFGFESDTVIADVDGIQTPTFHFPGIGGDAARLLADDPAIVGVGLDAPSLDAGNSHTFPAHITLFEAGKFGLEHLDDMSRVPATGATILALPMKIGGGSGGPCRVLVRLP